MHEQLHRAGKDSTTRGGWRRRVVPAALALLAGTAAPIAAAYSPSSPEFLINQTADCHQSESALAPAPDGGFLAAWNEIGSISAGVVVRRFGPDGEPLGDEQRVTSGGGFEADVTRVGDGYVVVWYAGILLSRRLDARAQPVATTMRLDSLEGDKAFPQVAPLPAGGFAVAWQLVTSPGQSHIYLRRFDALGLPLEVETRVDQTGIGVPVDGSAGFDLAAAADGTLAIAWQDARGVYARSYDPAGQPAGAEFPLGPPNRQALTGPSLAALPQGFVAAWTEQPAGGGSESVVARRFAATAPNGAEIPIRPVPAQSMSHSPGVAAGSDGDVVVLWVEGNGFSGGQVFASTVPAGGSAAGPPQQVNTSEEFGKRLPRAVFLANGSLASTWTAVAPVPPFLGPPCGFSGPDGNGDAVFGRVFAPACGSDTTLCLTAADRFGVSVRWRDPHNPPANGDGHSLPLTADTGGFWFFDPGNLELGVKVLDGRAVNGHFWVFYAALTNVEADISVTDRVTGDTRSYHKAPFQFGSAADTEAFASDAGSAVAAAATGPAKVIGTATTPCHLMPGALCFHQRFSARIAWRTPDGTAGSGTPVALSDESGYFWFFGPANAELFVKVLDGTALNLRHWVFFAGLTNVEFTLTVRDHASGIEREYRNPQGTFPSAADTSAF